MNNLRIRQLAGLSTDRAALVEAKKAKFIDTAETKEEPPEGLFATGSKAKIVKWLKSNHKDLKSAMSALNFYINRAGKNLDEDRKAVLDSCKEALEKAFAVKESSEFLRKIAGLSPIIESDEVEDTADGEGDEGEGDEGEEELPAVIRKIAKAAEGKEGEELEELLMKVYEAGQKDGKKQAEEAASKSDSVADAEDKPAKE
jgi:hypothetical protein